EIPVAYRLQHPQELALVETLRLRAEPAIGLARAALTYLRFHQQAPEWTAPRTGRCRIGYGGWSKRQFVAGAGVRFPRKGDGRVRPREPRGRGRRCGVRTRAGSTPAPPRARSLS